MNIKIKNYKNLKDLNYKIDDNKINFLFGMSGSGKSSILNAICCDVIEEGKKFGTADLEKPIALIDGISISPTTTHLFDVNKMNFLLEQTDVEHFKEVILINNAEHNKIHKELEDKISKLTDAINKEMHIYETYSSFLESLKIRKLTQGKLLPKASPFDKVIRKMKELSRTKLFKQIAAMDSKLFEWRMNGVELLTNNLCPFCGKKISKNKIKNLNKMHEFDAKAVGKVKNCLTNYSPIFNFDLSYDIKTMENIQKQIIKYAEAVNNFELINIQIHNLFEENFDCSTLTKISITKEFSRLFPLTSLEYKNVFSNIRAFKKSIIKTKETTETFLKGKKKIINDIFEKMDIPYEFSVKYHRSGPNEYSIIHKDDLAKSDDKNCMSEGERAIVALILFLISSKSTNYKIYFIDDPVSSFDVYRRKVIYDLILTFLKGKTVVVLSHDPVFAKFAISDAKNRYKPIGAVSYLSNNGKNSAIVQSVKNIPVESFNKSVLARFKYVRNQYQKVILSRLLLEERCGHKSIAYTYLSQILHGKPYNEIQNWIGRRNKNELSIIRTINRLLKKAGLRNNYLTSLNPQYNCNIDISGYSNYEKCIILRELANKNNNYPAMIVSELNNSIHLNDVLAVGINVFRFPIISRTLLDEVNNLPTIITL